LGMGGALTRMKTVSKKVGDGALEGPKGVCSEGTTPYPEGGEAGK